MHKLPDSYTYAINTTDMVLKTEPFKVRPLGADLVNYWQPGEMYYTSTQVFGNKKDLIAERAEKRRLEEELLKNSLQDDLEDCDKPAGYVTIHKGRSVGPTTSLLNNLQLYTDTWTYLNPGSLLTCLENDKEELVVKFLVLDNNGGYHDDDTGSTEPFIMWLDYANGMGGLLGFAFGHNNLDNSENVFELFNEETVEKREAVIQRFRIEEAERKNGLLNWNMPAFYPTPVQINSPVHIVTPQTYTINVGQNTSDLVSMPVPGGAEPTETIGVGTNLEYIPGKFTVSNEIKLNESQIDWEAIGSLIGTKI